MAFPVNDRYEEEPLEFWKAHHTILPHISKLENIYLGMTSASVPVESMFSVTDLIANHRWSSLLPNKLNRILFIHDNFNLIKGSLESQ